MSSSTTPNTEPWLRGTHSDVPVVSRAILYSFELAIDDAAKWTESLTDIEIHAQPLGLMSVASQLKHIAGSADRLLTYAEGRQLSEEQLRTLKAEQSGAETLQQLLDELRSALEQARGRVLALSSGDLDEPRKVGRKNLPTTLGGTLIHVAEHTQRHVGQLVTTAKILKALRG